MNELPEFLQKNLFGHESFALRAGVKVQVPRIYFEFQEWKGESVPNGYRKQVLNYNGEPVFAELAVLRMFQEHGWDGVWVDTYGKKYQTGLPGVSTPIYLPPEKEKIIASIRKKAGVSGGCWDVFVWKDDRVLFLELKRHKKDYIRDLQRVWLEAALATGLSPTNHALVEWDLTSSDTI